MISIKRSVHLLWMSFFCCIAASAQDFNPYGYASSVKQAIKAPNVSTLSIYYSGGMVYDEATGKHTIDASFEYLTTLKSLKQLRLNGAPADFNAANFFCSLAGLGSLESLELRMNIRTLGVLTDKQVNCLKKLRSLKRLNLPHQYPWDDLQKLQQALPNCEILINLYPEVE